MTTMENTMLVVTSLGVFTGTPEALRRKAAELALEYKLFKCNAKKHERPPRNMVEKLDASNTIYCKLVQKSFGQDD